MSTVKPATFPQITRQQLAQEASRQSNPPPELGYAKIETKINVKKVPVQVQPLLVNKATGAARTNREQTLEAAISVLEQKTIELYGPNKTKSKARPQLGQLIDIKA